MAELPRYRRDGLLSAVSPGFDSAALREGARASETLTRAMDRVSQMAFQVAGEQAKIEGIEYGAANAPTVEQLAKAKQSGEDLEEMLPGDTFSIFGQAARTTALNLIETSIESQARESITALQVGFEAGTVSLSDMQTQLATIEDSYSAVLSDISPTSAQKFRASIGVVGNSTFLSAAKTTMADQKKKEEVVKRYEAKVLLEGIPGQVSSLVNTIVKAGVQTNEAGEVISVDDKIEVAARQHLANLALSIDDSSFFDTYSERLDAEVSTAKVSVVTEYLKEDPLNRIPELEQDGVYLEDADVKSLFSILTAEEREAVSENIDNYVDELQSEADAREQRSTRRRQERANDIAPLINKAINSDDEESIRVYMNELESLDYSLWKSFVGVVNGGGAQIDNPEIVKSLNFKTTTGSLNLGELNDMFSERQITRSTYDSMFSRYEAQKDARYNEGLTAARNTLQYPEYDFIDMSDTQRKAIIKMKDLENEYLALKETATRAGQEAPDPYEFFTRRSAEIKNEGFDPQALQSSERIVNTFIEERGLNVSSYSEIVLPNDLSPEDYGKLDEALKMLKDQGIQIQGGQ